MASADRFGYEWARYNQLLPIYEEQFRLWVSPLVPADFRDKSVLDAGCGMGRNSYWAGTYGAKRIVAFDFDRGSVKAARQNLRVFPNVEVSYGSIYNVAYRDEFDIVFSIGVIHHLEQPHLALRKLFEAVKPGGRLVVWVYGSENNEVKIFIVNAIRSLASRLPPSITHFFTHLFSGPLYLYLKLWPWHSKYMKLIRRFSFKHIHLTVFDQIIPRVSHYWSRLEIEDLLKTLPPHKLEAMTHVLDYSWSVIITKPAH